PPDRHRTTAGPPSDHRWSPEKLGPAAVSRRASVGGPALTGL
ncbi:hypothetical protein A2U01_0100892, partial [Trifolium medium]|nr:hypothetical protein [Trifolium medium]